MKFTFIVLFSAVLLLSVNAVASHTSIVLASEELLQNSGFEQGISSWNTYNGELFIVESPVHNGSSAASLVINSQEGWIYQLTDIVPGEIYTLIGYALKNDPQTEHVRFQISWWDETEEISFRDSSWLTMNSSEYQLLTITATSPSRAVSARVKAIVHQTDPIGSATAYFDDISFVGLAPTPTPSPTPTITPSPTYTPSPTNSPAPQPVTTPSNEGDIIINEVQYDPNQTGADYAFEWLEILNRTEHPIDLNGWEIADNHDVDSIPSLILPAGRYAIIAATVDFYTNFPNFSGIIGFIADGSIGNGLSNDGDRLILTDSTGEIIDALSYGSDTSIMLPSCEDVQEGHSLERQPAGTDTNKASDFIDNEAPSPGNGLPSSVPTPTSTITVSHASLPTPTASSEPLPATTAPYSTHTTTITTPPTETLISPTNKIDPWTQLKVPLILLLVGLTLFTAVFWLKK